MKVIRKFTEKELSWFKKEFNQRVMHFTEYDNGCWKCTSHTGCDKHGYLSLRRMYDGKRRNMIAIRYMLYQKYNKIVFGKDTHVHHTCENPWCCNPDHAVMLKRHEHWDTHGKNYRVNTPSANNLGNRLSHFKTICNPCK